MKRVMKVLVAVAMGACVAVVSGCAFGTRHVDLADISFDSHRAPLEMSVVVPPVEDYRSDQDSVGCVRNGWGMKTAKVECVDHVPEWLRKSVVDSLRNAGINVIEHAAETDDPVVQVILHELYCESMMQYDAEVKVAVEIRVDGESRFKGKYSGTAQSMNWAATSSGFEANLNNAAADCFKEMIPELVRELEYMKPTP